jgi:hypothetical protein
MKADEEAAVWLHPFKFKVDGGERSNSDPGLFSDK